MGSLAFSKRSPIRTLMKRFKRAFRAAVFTALLALCLTGQTKKQTHAFIDKAALVDFVTPGLVITINSAAIAANGAITVSYTLADPNGLPLDATGATTPGVVSLAYVASYIPKGQPVTVTRDVIRTESCNGCHYQLAFHGGYAHGMQMCVLCHQPQNADPVTGNTLHAKVFFHQIHMGSQLPSVLGTKTTPCAPLEIPGYQNAIRKFSTVVDPADPRRCEVCHSQINGAAQATAFLSQP